MLMIWTKSCKGPTWPWFKTSLFIFTPPIPSLSTFLLYQSFLYLLPHSPLTLISHTIPPTIPLFNYWCWTKQTKVFVNLPFSLFPLLYRLLGSYGLNQLTYSLYRHSFRNKPIICKPTIPLSLSIQSWVFYKI